MMATQSRRTIHQLRVRCHASQEDIQSSASDKGFCDPRKCFGKVAITRKLDQEFPQAQSHKVRVDAGHIKANIHGYRWQADTPKMLRAMLINFDDKKKRHLVKPFDFSVAFVRMSKIDPSKTFSAARRAQINEARRQREVDTGKKDLERYTLRKRIVGFA
jgi:hypothetical protein